MIVYKGFQCILILLEDGGYRGKCDAIGFDRWADSLNRLQHLFPEAVEDYMRGNDDSTSDSN